MKAKIVVGRGHHGKAIIEKSLKELGWWREWTYTKKPQRHFALKPSYGLEQGHLDQLEDRLDAVAMSDYEGYHSHHDAGIEILVAD